MSLAQASPAPATLAGIALGRWLFGLRVWIAIMVALYAAFWLQLDGASSAATCVAILALPTRGQAFQKAIYRFGATVVGVVMSIVITGLFSQARDLFVIAYAAWIGICVFGANLLDGNRAYGVVLSGYTVAIVAVMQIDSPQDVFSSGINRGAAIVVGIAAMAFINDILAAPDIYPKVLDKVAGLRRKVRDFVFEALAADRADAVATGDLLKEITALHPEITATASESSRGPLRAAAARSAVAALVGEVTAARAFATRSRLSDDPAASALKRDLAEALGRQEHPGLRDRLEQELLDGDVGPERGLLLRHAADILEQDRLAAEELAALRASRRPERDIALPLYRSIHAAARTAFRVGLAVVFSSVLFILSSWPTTSVAFALIGTLGALSATTPSPRAFAMGALIAMPLAAVIAGVILFLVLDGADQFPLLCIAMAPSTVVACLMLTSPKTKLNGIGFLLLVFVPVIVAPSNPQSYNPQSYLFTSLLSVFAVMLLAFWLTVLSPPTDTMRRRWFVRAAARDLRRALRGQVPRHCEAETTYRAADRIGQLAGLREKGGAAKATALRHALLLADIEAAARRATASLDALSAAGDPRAPLDDARHALATLDPTALRQAAQALRAGGAAGAAGPSLPARRAGAYLITVADLARARGSALRRLLPRRA